MIGKSFPNSHTPILPHPRPPYPAPRAIWYNSPAFTGCDHGEKGRDSNVFLIDGVYTACLDIQNGLIFG